MNAIILGATFEFEGHDWTIEAQYDPSTPGSVGGPPDSWAEGDPSEFTLVTFITDDPDWGISCSGDEWYDAALAALDEAYGRQAAKEYESYQANAASVREEGW